MLLVTVLSWGILGGIAGIIGLIGLIEGIVSLTCSVQQFYDVYLAGEKNWF